MLLTRFVASIAAIGMMFAGAGRASGQDFPNRPIRVVTAPAGGAADFAARLVAQALTVTLGQPAIVENRGGGLIPGEFVAKAPPDGYTLLVHGSPLWLSQFLRSKMPYDVQRDFAAITFVAKSPNILVVHPSLPAKSVKELIALAKARPGVLNHSFGSAGGSNHLAAELFKSMAGVNIVGIPYKSDSVEIADLVSGQIDLTIGSGPTVTSNMKSGRLRALAVTSSEPSALFPGLPTIAASGVPGYEAGTLQALFAPAGTPAAIVNLLNHEILRSLTTAESKEKSFNFGLEIAGGSPQESATLVKSEIAKWGKVIKGAGIKAE